MIISIYSSIFPFNSLQLSTIAYGTIKICQRRRSVLENKIVDKTEMLCAFTVMMCHCVMCLRNYDSHMNVIIDIRPILEDQEQLKSSGGRQAVRVDAGHWSSAWTYVWSQQQSPPRSRCRHPAQLTVTLRTQFQGPGLQQHRSPALPWGQPAKHLMLSN